ncbi:MAG: DUF4366 domain-containing protein [Oscillospiraceae bacterium]|nr:DUF4366 domain-containing protein [Oscillospiraceae bacterium]
MKNSRWTFLALLLFVSAFFLPVTAYASSPADSTSPTITARISEKMLVIEAMDEDSGVKSVFIDGHETAYPAEGPLKSDLWNYAGAGQYVSAYAVDYAGNRSGTVQVENPYYKASLTDGKSDEAAVPEQSGAFTPDGTGTVQDNVTDETGKEFFTITTPDENVFYLIIDRERKEENVYFLNAVTEDDLRSLAKKEGGKAESAVPVPEVSPQPEASPSPGDTPAKQERDGDSTLIFVLLAVVIAGGAGYYFKIYKPKHQVVDTDEPEYDDNDEEYDSEPDIPDSEDTQDDFLSTEDAFGDSDDPLEEEERL